MKRSQHFIYDYKYLWNLLNFDIVKSRLDEMSSIVWEARTVPLSHNHTQVTQWELVGFHILPNLMPKWCAAAFLNGNLRGLTKQSHLDCRLAVNCHFHQYLSWIEDRQPREPAYQPAYQPAHDEQPTWFIFRQNVRSSPTIINFSRFPQYSHFLAEPSNILGMYFSFRNINRVNQNSIWGKLPFENEQNWVTTHLPNLTC